MVGFNTSVAQPDRLLEAEDPGTIYKQDARHWITVYRQMISFKDELLKWMRARADTLPEAGRRDVMQNDVAVIEVQLTRYQRRIEFWFIASGSSKGCRSMKATERSRVGSARSI